MVQCAGNVQKEGGGRGGEASYSVCVPPPPPIKRCLLSSCGPKEQFEKLTHQKTSDTFVSLQDWFVCTYDQLCSLVLRFC